MLWPSRHLQPSLATLNMSVKCPCWLLQLVLTSQLLPCSSHLADLADLALTSPISVQTEQIQTQTLPTLPTSPTQSLDIWGIQHIGFMQQTLPRNLATGHSLREKRGLLLSRAQQDSPTSACCQNFYPSCKYCGFTHLSKEHLAWQARIWFDSFPIVSCILHVLLPKLTVLFLLYLSRIQRREESGQGLNGGMFF